MVHSFTELHKAVIHVIILFRILGFPCCGPGSIPGPENEILQAVWHRSSIPGPPPKKGYDFVNTIFGPWGSMASVKLKELLPVLLTNKNLLYSTWNSAQCYVPGWM